MLRLLPILTHVDLPPSQIDLLPHFDDLPCEVVYNIRRSLGSPTPEQDLMIHSFPQEQPRSDLHFPFNIDLIDAALGYATVRSLSGIDTAGREAIIKEGQRLTWGGTQREALYTNFATCSLLFDGYRFSKMDMPGPTHLVVGKGYGFYLMGDRAETDPSQRFGDIQVMMSHYPKLREYISGANIKADLFVGITLWGERSLSSHRKLQITEEIGNLLPKLCVGIETCEVLTPIWPTSRPDRIHYEASSTTVRTRQVAKGGNMGVAKNAQIYWQNAT
jgi:hypothetical protein